MGNSLKFRAKPTWHARCFQIVNPKIIMKTTQIPVLVLAVWIALLILIHSVSAQAWTQTSAPLANWQAIACSADGSKLAATFRGGSYMSTNTGGVYTSTNFGVNWVLASNAPAVFTSFPFIASSADGSKLAVVCDTNTPAGGHPGLIYVSDDFGATWSQTSATLGLWFGLASSADGNDLLAIDNEGRAIYTSTNSGLT